jgi:hypothetical protein
MPRGSRILEAAHLLRGGVERWFGLVFTHSVPVAGSASGMLLSLAAGKDASDAGAAGAGSGAAGVSTNRVSSVG